MEEQFSVRLEKLKKINELGITPYPYRFDSTMRFGEIIAKFKDSSAEDLKETAQEVELLRPHPGYPQHGQKRFHAPV